MKLHNDLITMTVAAFANCILKTCISTNCKIVLFSKTEFPNPSIQLKYFTFL